MDYIQFHPNRDNMKVDAFFGEMIADNISCYTPGVRSILDLGAGRGYLVDEFNKHGFRAYGVDLRAVFETDRSKFAVADIRNLPFGDNTFDLVCETFAIMDMWQLQGFGKDQIDAEVNKVISEAHRVLRPHGYLFALSNPFIFGRHGFEIMEVVEYRAAFPLYRKIQKIS